MKKKPVEPFKKVLRIYLSDKDFDKILAAAQETMCSSLSDYGSKTLLSQPVTIQYRNRSADEAVEASIEMIMTLKKCLSHPSFTEEEKYSIQRQITNIEEITLNLFDLCLPGRI